MKKTILIVGGAGFIGSNLCKRLFNQDNKIICLDNLYTGSKENIQNLLNKDNFEFIEHDIVNPIDIKADEIYNLACPASPVHYQTNPIQTIKTSVLGIINLLELTKKYNSKLLFTSTSEVYGNPTQHPQKESYWGNVNPIGVRSCYDEGKRCAETFIYEYQKKYNLKTKIVRLFNTFGENMKVSDGRVVSNFIIQALQNKPLTVYGDGSQTRSICYINDTLDGIIKMMNSSDDILGPINLGNPNEMTILELAQLIINLTNSKSMIIFKELPKDDPIKRKPDITLAKEKLNWQPKTSQIDGLKNTIKYFNKKLNYN